MSRLLWIARNYPPDLGAPAYRLHHATRLLAENHRVVVLAAQPNRYEGLADAPSRETRDGVEIERIWNGSFRRSGDRLGRGLGELCGALWAGALAWWRHRRCDAVVVSTPPLFYTLAGLLLHRLAGVALVVDVRDLWLDWAVETGTIRSRLLVRVLRWLERSVIESAARITVATRSFGREIAQRFAVDPERITVIYNGLDDAVRPTGAMPVGPRGGSPDTRRILYAGNLGPSQNLLGILDGLGASLDKWPGLEILIVGSGSQREALEDRAHPRLVVRKQVDRREMAGLYAGADAFLLHLADLDVYRHTVPSKIFEYAAWGRLGKPVLCGVTGEARELCARHTDCYFFGSDDSKSFLEAVDRLMGSAPPDNQGSERGDESEILRSGRDALWRAVFADASG